MRYQTEMTQAILTSERARRILDFVSPIYGESYVALWIYQAIGYVLDDVGGIAEQLRWETTPATAKLLIAFWEAQYGLSADESLSLQQRRNRIIAKISSRGPCNPRVLARAVSAALGGVEVDITENVDKNTFSVNLHNTVADPATVAAIVDRMKPAHLIYRTQTVSQVVATAYTGAACVGEALTESAVAMLY